MDHTLKLLKQMAHGIAKQFGTSCEVVIHDLNKDLETSIVHIENGQVTNRKFGDGPSGIVLETLHKNAAKVQDKLSYLTRTEDGRILKSSTLYIRDADEKISYIFSINYDITALLTIDRVSPQAENIPEMCKAVEAAGADAISLTNTFQACAIDLEKRRPVFNNIFAGLSGPAVRPIALRMVWQAVGAVNIPVVGLGGIATGRDALEFIMAGAAAVQVGAANFANPRAMETIADEMAAWMDKNGVKTLDEIRGCARNAE